MEKARRKPTRRDLIIIIGRLQGLIGDAIGRNGNDQSPDRFEETVDVLQKAHDLCIEVRSYEPPINSNLGPWGQDELYNK